MTDLPQIIAPIDAASIGSVPQTFQVAASEAECERIAAALGIPQVRRLAAELAVVRDQEEAIMVTGAVDAEIVQECVVSFVPVGQSITEVIDLRFTESPDGADVEMKPGTEVNLEEVEGRPEPLEDGVLDLNALILEHVALAIDPYPRAEGAEIPEDYAKKARSPDESPFAVLSKLVDR